jgi:hypothetical protein
MLSKKKILFDMNDKGELLPIETELVVNTDDELQSQYVGEKVKITPLSRDEIRAQFKKTDVTDAESNDFDKELILTHCKEPSFTAQEINALKPAFVTMLVNTILDCSGIKTKTKKLEVPK